MIGSVHMFSDQYFDKEENSKVQVSSSITNLFPGPMTVTPTREHPVYHSSWCNVCSFYLNY